MWTQQHFADLYRNGYLILRGLVPVELVGPAKAALENGKDGSAPEILSLLRDSPLHQFLCEGLRGGGYNKVDGAQAGANGPREPGTRNMQTGWPEVDVPFYGWCGHVDGIWSGGASAPQGRGDPTFDPKKFYSEPAVNGHMLEYGEHEGCRANLQLVSALVGVSLSEQLLDGAGQIGVLEGAHLPMAGLYIAQRARGGPVGPGGPFWPREDFNAPNGHGVRHYPDFVPRLRSLGIPSCSLPDRTVINGMISSVRAISCAGACLV